MLSCVFVVLSRMPLIVAFKFSHLLLHISYSLKWNTDAVGNLIVIHSQR